MFSPWGLEGRTVCTLQKTALTHGLDPHHGRTLWVYATKIIFHELLLKSCTSPFPVYPRG